MFVVHAVNRTNSVCCGPRVMESNIFIQANCNKVKTVTYDVDVDWEDVEMIESILADDKQTAR